MTNKATSPAHLARRDFLKFGGGGLAGLALLGASACGADDEGGDSRLRMTWWGTPERHKRTREALKIIQRKNQGFSVNAQYTGFQGYFDRLATQTAGGNAPDLFGMTTIFVAEYAERNTLLKLDPFLDSGLDLGNAQNDAVEGGRVKGALYGLPFGMNAYAITYDATTLDDLGVTIPDQSWTWDDFTDFTTEAAKSKKNYYGTADLGGSIQPFEVFVRQRDGNVYNDAGQLGFTKEDLGDWLSYWDQLRKSGAAVPPDITAEAQGPENSVLITGKAAMLPSFSDQYLMLTSLTENELDIINYPTEPSGPAPGAYLKPSVLLSAYSKSSHKEEAVKVMNAFLNDQEVGKTLGLTAFGVPASTKTQELVQRKLSPTEQKSFDYVTWVSKNSGPAAPQRPKGGGEIDNTLLAEINENIGFGELDVRGGVQRFFSEAERILGK